MKKSPGKVFPPGLIINKCWRERPDLQMMKILGFGPESLQRSIKHSAEIQNELSFKYYTCINKPQRQLLLRWLFFSIPSSTPLEPWRNAPFRPIFGLSFGLVHWLPPKFLRELQLIRHFAYFPVCETSITGVCPALENVLNNNLIAHPAGGTAHSETGRLVGWVEWNRDGTKMSLHTQVSIKKPEIASSCYPMLWVAML